MNQIIKDFFEKENRKCVQLEVLPNGVRYRLSRYKTFNVMHERFIPLTLSQIDILQQEVSEAQKTQFIFPDWYRDVLATTNGCNLFFDCSQLDGEQTPTFWSEQEQRYVKTLLDRNDPNWMAPYDLCFNGSIKYNNAARARWLTIGSYMYDGTKVAWDYKFNNICAMYSLPSSISIKSWKKLREEDYEERIFARWDSFDAFFIQETERLRHVILKYGVDMEKGFIYRDKTLPIGHKDYSE